jgi:hypothetical protein
MNRNEPVTIYEPVDSSSARYLGGLTLPKNTHIAYESESDSDADGRWDKFFRVGEMVEVRHNDDNKAQALAEYIAGCINLHRSITLALGRATSSDLAMVRPDNVDALLEALEQAGEPSARLDDLIHDHFQIEASFALPYTTSMDAALAFFRTALPGYGYLLSHSGSTNGYHRQFYVAKALRPAKNPDGSITDGDSWATHYEAGAITEAMALVIATLKAVKANP